jgi:preprotein translocase subunit SecG
MIVLIVVHLMLVIALIGVVLLQKSEGGGLVSSSSGFLTGRGTANVLTRTTALLAAGFFLTSLALSWFASYDHKQSPIVGAPPGQETQSGSPTAPLNQGKGGLLGTLSNGIPNAPAGPQNAPPPPSGPQVPQSH